MRRRNILGVLRATTLLATTTTILACAGEAESINEPAEDGAVIASSQQAEADQEADLPDATPGKPPIAARAQTAPRDEASPEPEAEEALKLPAPTSSAEKADAGAMASAAPTGALGGALEQSRAKKKSARRRPVSPGKGGWGIAPPPPPPEATLGSEGYDHIAENDFIAVADDPRSTFSIDVDTASYANVRRFIEDGSLPPTDAVRIEELVNYFSYDYEAPIGQPFSVNSEVGACPWNQDHMLVSIGLQGQIIDQSETPARNLVFLLDVSGSMNNPDKLPLLKKGLALLVENLRPEDRVSIVVYAGASGVVLEPTSGNRQDRILEALEQLQAGGSTNGGAGISLAYELAEKTFIEDGINRVILATDGDFNVGPSSRGELVRLIEDKRKSGVFLSVLGFGTGNVKDSSMEQLADKGNGNYAYIDSIFEAKKVLVEEAGSTLVTIAKDVKLQVEFNPREVGSYRLIGYENRKLAHSDFNDDTKDAGEIGAGHSVTALYEIVPASGRKGSKVTDDLKYQDEPALSAASGSGELLTVNVRYKPPKSNTSKKLSVAVTGDDRGWQSASKDYRFAAAVAEFGMLLRQSEHRGEASYDQVIELAQGAVGKDPHGHRRAFVDLVRKARRLAGREGGSLARAE